MGRVAEQSSSPENARIVISITVEVAQGCEVPRLTEDDPNIGSPVVPDIAKEAGAGEDARVVPAVTVQIAEERLVRGPSDSEARLGPASVVTCVAEMEPAPPDARLVTAVPVHVSEKWNVTRLPKAESRLIRHSPVIRIALELTRLEYTGVLAALSIHVPEDHAAAGNGKPQLGLPSGAARIAEKALAAHQAGLIGRRGHEPLTEDTIEIAVVRVPDHHESAVATKGHLRPGEFVAGLARVDPEFLADAPPVVPEEPAENVPAIKAVLPPEAGPHGDEVAVRIRGGFRREPEKFGTVPR